MPGPPPGDAGGRVPDGAGPDGAGPDGAGPDGAGPDGAGPDGAPRVHRNVRRVLDAAAARGLDVELRRFPAGTRTAQEAAAAIGVQVAQIVKSLVFEVDGRPVLALVAGDDRLDEARLAAAAGGRRCARPDAAAVRAATGFPIGGIPPLGHATDLPVFVDPALLVHDRVWAAAGTGEDVFGADPAALAAACAATVAHVRRG